jgi:hypothetical protein
MYLRPLRPTTRFDDYGLAAAVGILLGIYAGFFFGLYWFMQPSVAANPGLAAYQPPPKTVVRYADAPWVPPPSSESLPIQALDEPAAEVASSNVTEEPKRETKKHQARTTPRRVRSVREQRSPFSGYASSHSFGFRPWF